MDETVSRSGNTKRRRRRTVGGFPRIHVQSRPELAHELRRWRWLLDKRAQAEFGPGAEATEAVRATIVKLLAIEEPDFPHVIHAMTQTLRNECRSIRLRQARATAAAERKARGLVDPVLGEITGARREAVERLSDPGRQAIYLAAQGLSPEDIGLLVGKSRKTVRMRLFRARAQVRADLGQQGAAEGVFALPLFPWVCHRTRAAGHVASATARRVPRVAVWHRGALARCVEAVGRAASSPQLSTTAALAAVVASWATVVETQPVGAPTSIRTVDGAQPGAAATTGESPPTPTTVAQRSRGVALSNVGGTAVLVHARRLGSVGGSAEVPEDVRMTTAATPPRAPSAAPPAIVAVGAGQTCQCQVLLQSLDGGVTWTATDGPLIALNQLVLPPSYPADSRIFASSGDAYSGALPYEAPRFGAPFQPLALPAGQIAVASGFDAGDPRLFVSALTGVWSLDLAVSTGAAAPRLEVEYASAAAGAVAALATPPASSSSLAVLAWVPTLATVPGSLAPPNISARLMACASSRGLCSPMSDLPSPPVQLAVGADAANVVIAYGMSSSVFVSRDGGRSFSAASPPPGASVAFSAVVVGRAGEVWASFMFGPASARVERLTGEGAWTDATQGDASLRAHAGTLLAVGARRIVAMLPGLGYRCNTVSEPGWTPRCPPA